MTFTLPPELEGVFFPFRWDNSLVHALPTATTHVPFDELSWHLDLPVWSTAPPRPLFDLRPRAVLDDPATHPGHFQRIVNAPLHAALEMFEHGGRWVVMDGYHRLAHHRLRGSRNVPVRRHAEALLASVRIDQDADGSS